MQLNCIMQGDHSLTSRVIVKIVWRVFYPINSGEVRHTGLSFRKYLIMNNSDLHKKSEDITMHLLIVIIKVIFLCLFYRFSKARLVLQASPRVNQIPPL